MEKLERDIFTGHRLLDDPRPWIGIQVRSRDRCEGRPPTPYVAPYTTARRSTARVFCSPYTIDAVRSKELHIRHVGIAEMLADGPEKPQDSKITIQWGGWDQPQETLLPRPTYDPGHLQPERF